VALVRVIIPTYNRAALVCNAIRSVLSQNFSDFEVVVVDDGSTDDTRAAVAALAEQDARVTYLYKHNGGVSSARNAGVMEPGSFSYVAFLDSDDEWIEQGHLRQCVDIFEEAPDVDVVYARVRTVDHFGQWTPERILGRENRYAWPKEHRTRTTSRGAMVIEPAAAFRGLLAQEICPHPSTVVVRVARIGIGAWFDVELEIFEDMDFFTRLARRRVFAFSDSVRVLARYHGDNLTTRHSLDSPITLRHVRSVLSWARRAHQLCATADERRIASKELAGQTYLLGQCLAEQGRNREARRFYLESLWRRPGVKTCRSLLKAAALGLFERRVGHPEPTAP
jgi:glycosyltransferase involved in cell wall biosynthesis